MKKMKKEKRKNINVKIFFLYKHVHDNNMFIKQQQ